MKATLLETTPPPKEEEGGQGGGAERIHEDRAKNSANGFQSHLELRLGISFNEGFEDGAAKGDRSPTFLAPQDGLELHQRSGVVIGGAKRSFSETTSGFVHPWSLAARQEKAALEQNHQKPNPSSSLLGATDPSPPVVGWPPICAFRRHLGFPQASKSAMDSEKDAEKTKPEEGENKSNKPVARQTMFVKVNMEGYAVGRKIDLKVHHSYDSLSEALQKMFHNFLTADYLKKSKQDGPEKVTAPNYILLYEDNEGDRMLVGDVPWEMFISTVKRLYIAQDHRAQKYG